MSGRPSTRDRLVAVSASILDRQIRRAVDRVREESTRRGTSDAREVLVNLRDFCRAEASALVYEEVLA